MDANKWLEHNTIFKYIAGSHSYGLNTPESDIDYRGVCIAPKEYHLGLFVFEQTVTKEPDSCVTELKKYVKLAADCNPNIIEFMFAPEDCLLKTSRYWEWLKDKRHMFLSKKAKFTYAGYAFAQLKRIKSHKSWLLNPPKNKPNREDFGLGREKMSDEYIGYINSIIRSEANIKQEDINSFNFSIEEVIEVVPIARDVIKLYERERAYKNAAQHFDQYEEWKKSRNPKRAELEAKFGYDTKHAMHVFRLLIQAEDILSTEILNVRLSEEQKEFCRAMRAGAYTYERMLELAEEKMALLDTLYDKSTLPHSVNLNYINELLVGIIDEFYVRRGV